MDPRSSSEGADRLQALLVRFREGEKAILVKAQQLLKEKQTLEEKLAEIVDLKSANVGLREDLDEHESRVEATSQSLGDLERIARTQLQRQHTLFTQLSESEQTCADKERQFLGSVRGFVEEVMVRVNKRVKSREEVRAKLGKDVLWSDPSM